ncbi:MAG: DUF6958 family protein [Actinomycetales bacterium]
MWPGGAKVGWWQKTVQLDLEAKGMLKRDAASNPMRWYRVGAHINDARGPGRQRQERWPCAGEQPRRRPQRHRTALLLHRRSCFDVPFGLWKPPAS